MHGRSVVKDVFHHAFAVDLDVGARPFFCDGREQRVRFGDLHFEHRSCVARREKSARVRALRR